MERPSATIAFLPANVIEIITEPCDAGFGSYCPFDLRENFQRQDTANSATIKGQ
jgi:hypothetical protein